MKQIVIIAGSPSRTSRLTGLLLHVEKMLIREDIQVLWIHVPDLPAEDLLTARFDSPAIVQANLLVEQADAVIIGSPIYKASYTGVLKAYLDLLPQKGLAGKITLPVCIGGTIAHLLSIDYALKPLLSILGSRTQLGGVYAVDTQVTKNETGEYELADELIERLNGAAAQLIQQLST